MFDIKLRAFDYQTDICQLYDYMMKEDNQILFSHSFQIHNLPMFESWISEKFSRNEYHDFFIIESNKGVQMGFVYSYEYHPHDLNCKFTLCLYEEYQHRGLGAIAGIKMLDYLFRKYPLKQVFISVFDYNINSLSSNLKGGFVEVGILPEYRFCGGKFYALHILRISREVFYERHYKILGKLKQKQ